MLGKLQGGFGLLRPGSHQGGSKPYLGVVVVVVVHLFIFLWIISLDPTKAFGTFMGIFHAAEALTIVTTLGVDFTMHLPSSFRERTRTVC